MELHIKTSVLSSELGKLQSIVQKKNTIPVLSNILIETTSGRGLKITGTDMDVVLSSSVEAEEIVSPGSVLISAKKFFDVARLLPEGFAHLKSETNGWLNIKTGKAKFRISGMEPEQFPPVQTQNANALIQLHASDIKKLINSTSFAAAPEEHTRFMLNGAKFILNESGAKMITADGHRLAYAHIDLSQEQIDDLLEDLDIFIPQKGILELNKLITDYDDQVDISFTNNAVAFQAGNRFLSVRLQAGEFPAYEKVLQIAEGCTNSVPFVPSELKTTIKRASLMSDDKTYAVRMKFENGSLDISANNSENGEAQDSLDSMFHGEPVEIALNSKYLIDYLDACNAKEVFFEFKDGNSAARLRCKDANSESKYIISPVRM